MSLESQITNLLNNPQLGSMDEWNSNIRPKLSGETNISLSNICKTLKLKKSGKKEELVKIIIDHVEKTNIMDKLRSTINIFQNENNNFEVENTNLIVSPETKLVVGHEVNGRIEKLTEEEVLQCQELRLNYDISKIQPNTGLLYLITEDDTVESDEDGYDDE